MSRLIDVDALIEAHYDYCNKHHGEADVFYTWSLKLMKEAPTVSCITCTNCVYWRKLGDGEYHCIQVNDPHGFCDIGFSREMFIAQREEQKRRIKDE